MRLVYLVYLSQPRSAAVMPRCSYGYPSWVRVCNWPLVHTFLLYVMPFICISDLQLFVWALERGSRCILGNIFIFLFSLLFGGCQRAQRESDSSEKKKPTKVAHKPVVLTGMELVGQTNRPSLFCFLSLLAIVSFFIFICNELTTQQPSSHVQSGPLFSWNFQVRYYWLGAHVDPFACDETMTTVFCRAMG